MNAVNHPVYLVGAGPGDPDLLTVKAVRVIGEADVLLVDDLVGRGVLDCARPGARVIEVGKRGGKASTSQQFIERLLVRKRTEMFSTVSPGAGGVMSVTDTSVPLRRTTGRTCAK